MGAATCVGRLRAVRSRPALVAAAAAKHGVARAVVAAGAIIQARFGFTSVAEVAGLAVADSILARVHTIRRRAVIRAAVFRTGLTREVCVALALALMALPVAGAVLRAEAQRAVVAREPRVAHAARVDAVSCTRELRGVRVGPRALLWSYAVRAARRACSNWGGASAPCMLHWCGH